MSCQTCVPYCTTIPDCLTSLGVVLSEVDTDVVVTITDKFKNDYQWVGVTESNGLYVLDLQEEDIPELLLNPFAGEFTLIARDVAGEIVPFTDGVNFFECATFNVKATYPKKTTHYIDPENKFPSYS